MSNDTFIKSVDLVLEVVMFENWLRFYFIGEQEGSDKLFIHIPEKGIKKIKELYPHLLSLAEAVNNKEITFDSSRAAVCEHVLVEVDGKTIPKEMSALVFDSLTFQVELQLFNTWVQGYEEHLDDSFLEFGAWRNFFSQWRQDESIQNLAKTIFSSLNANNKDTVQ